MDSSLAMLKAVIARLSSSTALQEMVSGRIYNEVPQNSPFPYILVSIDSQPFAANDFSGQLHTVRLRVFSQAASTKEPYTIRALALELLDRREDNINLSAGTLVKCEYSGASTSFKEDDGKTWQAIAELEAIVV